MKVKALISFVGYDGNGNKHRVQAGDEFELPTGVDWLEKKLVESISQVPKGRGKKAQENLL